MTTSPDVVVVGAGIAGSALAIALARGGLEVTVLERETAYRDKVRGEVFVPWGAAEVRRLRIDDVLLGAGGGYVTRLASIDEEAGATDGEPRAVPLDQLLPDVPGSLNVGHPEACQALADAARAAGATVVRGVGDIAVTPGSRPRVTYRLGAVDHEMDCRLAVGADGRRSMLRRHLGIHHEESEPVVIGGGMLVDEAAGWPGDLNVTSTHDDVYFLAFPRPGHRVRVYLMWAMTQKGRFTGPERQRQFLEACRSASLTYADAVADGHPAGPCSSYPMNDSRCDTIVADGLVLVGDAAGWSDPIIGQGLSVAVRDARMVSEVLLGGGDWSSAAFGGYVEQRTERMRRISFSARLTTVLRTTFGPEGRALRQGWGERTGHDPLVLAPVLAVLTGPERAPGEAFTDANMERCLGRT